MGSESKERGGEKLPVDLKEEMGGGGGGSEGELLRRGWLIRREEGEW